MMPAEDAAEWFAKADEDIRVARDLLELAHVPACAFHAQQAAEKALKAILVKREGRLERTHDLQRLCALLGIRDLRILENAETLALYYTATRYPGAPGHVTSDEAADALARAEEVLEWCKKA